MYRQFAALKSELPLLVTWNRLNEDQFALTGTDVQIVPEQFGQQIRGWQRRIDTMLRPRVGGDRFGRRFDRWLQQKLIDAKIDGVIGQFGNVAMTAETACNPIGIPTFAHFHGFDITARLRKHRYRKAITAHWHDFAGIICVAGYQRDWLLQHGYDSEAVALIPCGAPTREIQQKTDALRSGRPPQTSQRAGECRFLFIGRFVDKKDPLSLLKAFGRCFRSQPHSRLRIAGFGPLESACREWIDAQPNQLRSAISMLDTLSPQQVLEQFVEADVYVQHSRLASNGDKEGWPVVIAEAMAAGLPVVSTRHAGIIDQVVEEQTGYLSEEADWQAMGDNMARIAADPSARKAMGIATQQRMIQFDSATQVQRMREFVGQRIDQVNFVRKAA